MTCAIQNFAYEIVGVGICCPLKEDHDDDLSNNPGCSYSWHPPSCHLLPPWVYRPKMNSPSRTLPVTAKKKPTLYVITASILKMSVEINHDEMLDDLDEMIFGETLQAAGAG